MARRVVAVSGFLGGQQLPSLRKPQGGGSGQARVPRAHAWFQEVTVSWGGWSWSGEGTPSHGRFWNIEDLLLSGDVGAWRVCPS